MQRVKAIGLTQFGGPEVLQVVDLPDPEPGPGEVRIQVQAVAVNPTDITFRSGGRSAQIGQRPAPYVPGMDVAGVVDKLGEDSDGRLGMGDRVIAYVNPFGPHGGSYTEQLVVAQASTVRAPANSTLPEAATLLLTAVTARLSLNALALAPPTLVGIVGAAGAMGGFATEMATSDGLTVLAYVADADEARVRSLGADQVVLRRKDAATDIRAAIPNGVPALIDGATLNAAALGAIADDGALVTLRGWDGPTERGITIHPVDSFGSATDTALLDQLSQDAEHRKLTLRVAEVLPASQAAQAHRLLETGGVRGRIVLDFANPQW